MCFYCSMGVGVFTGSCSGCSVELGGRDAWEEGESVVGTFRSVLYHKHYTMSCYQ